MGEPHEGEPWLRLAAEATCPPVGILRLPEVSAQAVHLPLPVCGMTKRSLVQDSLRELLCDATCLVECVRPGAAQSHDLGAMHEAEPPVRHHVRLLLTPARQRLGPLTRAPELVDVATERDGVAVDDARHRSAIARRS